MKRNLTLLFMSVLLSTVAATIISRYINNGPDNFYGTCASSSSLRKVVLEHQNFPDFTYAAENCVEGVVFVKVLKREKNRELVFLKDPTDFIIASNISSMIMAQIAGNFRLRYLFDELLSNRGSEIYLRTAESIGCSDERITIREVRHRAIEFGYLVMGYLLKERGEGDLHMDPDPESKVTLRPDDYLVVVGKK